jgi:hypothetical protein
MKNIQSPAPFGFIVIFYIGTASTTAETAQFQIIISWCFKSFLFENGTGTRSYTARCWILARNRKDYQLTAQLNEQKNEIVVQIYYFLYQ